MEPIDPFDPANLLPAETWAFASPIPTQFVASERYERGQELVQDKVALARAACCREGGERTNKRPGHVAPPRA